jgi:hypothetical protein
MIQRALGFCIIVLMLLILLRHAGQSMNQCKREVIDNTVHYRCFKSLVFEGDDFLSFLRLREISYKEDRR